MVFFFMVSEGACDGQAFQSRLIAHRTLNVTTDISSPEYTFLTGWAGLLCHFADTRESAANIIRLASPDFQSYNLRPHKSLT